MYGASLLQRGSNYCMPLLSRPTEVGIPRKQHGMLCLCGPLPFAFIYMKSVFSQNKYQKASSILKNCLLLFKLRCCRPALEASCWLSKNLSAFKFAWDKVNVHWGNAALPGAKGKKVGVPIWEGGAVKSSHLALKMAGSPKKPCSGLAVSWW